MGYEIERKYLVKDTTILEDKCGVLYRQAYIATTNNNVVRLRTVDKNAYITLKGENNGVVRLEYEYEIPLKDANEIIENLCQKPIIEKMRYTIYHEGFEWVIDKFLGENSGLIMAEIELPNKDTVFTKPSFIGQEVTGDVRYYNSNLVKNPYSTWN